ncbi:hypothetical protein K504DRAFT_263383 [Pleomassaria siparia CBS 279.74]|uniref:Uncharacterized protein n=1 Tax=Pleomassaria siparia CBS 279.74 TaxID=1314801 RepID=A0A6G1KCX2_9PLEO|nr:hypothetical protein K504DRAFT_263383 [Pleomassaria siparia CBS 279.74]
MPPWGRPPGEGVGRYREQEEDVYRFQELGSDDQKDGVLLEPIYQQVAHGKQVNPDELYFNDMDMRAWEARTAEVDSLAYGDDSGYQDGYQDGNHHQEDEGYYDEAGRMSTWSAEYQEFLFLRVLDKIRLARATGNADVQLSSEELDAYTRGLRPRAPAARPPPHPMRGRPVSAPLISGVVNGGVSNAIVSANTSSTASSSGLESTKQKKSQQRTSIFGTRSRKEKERTRPSSRKRAPSNSSETLGQIQQPQQPPGFVVSGPNGPVYAPINAYGRMRGDSIARPAASPSRESRSASLNSRHAQTPPRGTPPREIPGAFPSGSPHRYYRESTPPPRAGRPPSSHSRYSRQDSGEFQASQNTRSRSSPIQQPVKLVPFPITDYQHHTAEPYQYYTPGQPTAQPSSQPSVTQPQYGRRVVAAPADPSYTSMPRRVPVSGQRVAALTAALTSSHSNPDISRSAGLSGETSDDDAGLVVDVVPKTDDKSYKVQTAKAALDKASSSSRVKDGSRRSSGRTRRKN